jgi:hypothetical protein
MTAHNPARLTGVKGVRERLEIRLRRRLDDPILSHSDPERRDRRRSWVNDVCEALAAADQIRWYD